MSTNQHVSEESQHRLRVVLALTTLFLSCLASALSAYVFLHFFSKFIFPPYSVFCTRVALGTELAQCWLLLFFNIPTQMKGYWVFGFLACVSQGFLSRVLKGSSLLAITILATQSACSTSRFPGHLSLFQHSKAVYFILWILMSSASILPFVLKRASYNFNTSLSHCDVGDYNYFLIHDLITYCIPASFLSVLSVRLIVCVVQQWSFGVGPQDSHDSHRGGKVIAADDDPIGFSPTEATRMTSQQEGSGVMRSGSAAGGRWSGVDVKWTMTVCFLSAETTCLLAVEWSLRRWGCLLPSPSLTASSVLFACAGYVVRPATIIIVERAFRATSLLSSFTSSVIGENETVTSMSHHRHRQYVRRPSWELQRKTPGRRNRERKKSVQQRSSGSRSTLHHLHSETLNSFSSSILDTQPRKSSSATPISQKRSSSPPSSSGRAAAASRRPRNRTSRESFCSATPSQDSQRWANMFQRGSVISQVSQPSIDTRRSNSIMSTTSTASRRTPSASSSPEKKPPASSCLFQRLSNRKRSSDTQSTQGRNDVLSMIKEQNDSGRQVSGQIPLLRKAIDNQTSSRFSDEDKDASRRRSRQYKTSGASPFPSHGSFGASGKDYFDLQGDCPRIRGTGMQTKSAAGRKMSQPITTEESRRMGMEVARPESAEYPRRTSSPTTFKSSDTKHSSVSEGRIWDGRPDTLSTAWLRAILEQRH